MTNFNFTDEELQHILDAVIFTYSPDMAMDESAAADDVRKNILKKFSEQGWSTSRDTYIFGTEYYEDPEKVQFIESSGLTELRQ